MLHRLKTNQTDKIRTLNKKNFKYNRLKDKYTLLSWGPLWYNRLINIQGCAANVQAKDPAARAQALLH